jgi:hypothetical protein
MLQRGQHLRLFAPSTPDARCAPHQCPPLPPHNPCPQPCSLLGPACGAPPWCSACGSGGVIMRASSAGTSVAAPRIPFTSSTSPCRAGGGEVMEKGRTVRRQQGGWAARRRLPGTRQPSQRRAEASAWPGRCAGDTRALAVQPACDRFLPEPSQAPRCPAAPPPALPHLQRCPPDLRRSVARHAAPGGPREKTVTDARAHAARSAAALLRRRLRGTAKWEGDKVEGETRGGQGLLGGSWRTSLPGPSSPPAP